MVCELHQFSGDGSSGSLSLVTEGFCFIQLKLLSQYSCGKRTYTTYTFVHKTQVARVCVQKVRLTNFRFQYQTIHAMQGRCCEIIESIVIYGEVTLAVYCRFYLSHYACKSKYCELISLVEYTSAHCQRKNKQISYMAT